MTVTHTHTLIIGNQMMEKQKGENRKRKIDDKSCLSLQGNEKNDSNRNSVEDQNESGTEVEEDNIDCNSSEVTNLAKEMSTARSLLVILAQENARLTKLLETYMESDDSLLCSSQLEDTPAKEEAIDLSQASELDDLVEDSTWDYLMEWFEREEATQKRLGAAGSKSLISTSSIRNTISRSGSLRKSDSLSRYGSLKKADSLSRYGSLKKAASLSGYLGASRSDSLRRPQPGGVIHGEALVAKSPKRQCSARLPLTPDLSPQSNMADEREYLVLEPQKSPFCKHPASEVVRVGVGVLVTSLEYEGCVLVGKRKGSISAGYWGLPGGHLEKGETLEQCAEREVLEETGLEVKVIPQFGEPYAWITNCPDIDGGLHYVTIFIRARQINCEKAPEVLEPDKCEGWEWADWHLLRQNANCQATEAQYFQPLLKLLKSSYELI